MNSTKYNKQIITEHVLTNGLRVFFIQDPTASLVSVRSFVRAGSALEDGYYGTGISHYLEHLVAGGATHKRPEQEYKEITTSLGGAYNAYTTTDHTSYYLNSQPEQVLKACDVIYEWMFYCKFDERECQREREVILKEIEKNEASLSRSFYRLCQNNFYKYHALKFPVIGYLENFKTLTRQDLVDYYNRFYTPSNMALVIGGDISVDSLLEHIKNTFGKEMTVAPPPTVLFNEPKPFSSRFIKEEGKTNVTMYSLRFSTCNLFDKDLYPLDLLENILGNGEDSLLCRALIEDKNIAYSVSVTSLTPSITTGFFDISVECELEHVHTIRSTIMKIIDELKNGNFTDRLLLRAKKQKVAEEILSVGSIEDKVSKIGQAYLYAHCIDFYEKYVENFKAVEKNDISRAAKLYLDSNRLIETQLIPQSEKKKKSALKTSSKKHSEIIVPKLHKLKSGAKLLLYTDRSFPRVYSKCFFMGGLRSETSQNNGIGMLLSELCGEVSENYSKRDIKSLIDDNGAEMELVVGSNTLYYNLTCLSEDFTQLYPIMLDTLFRPRFMDEDFKEAKRKALKWIEQREDDWFSYCQYHYKKYFYKKHPYGFSSLGERVAINKISKHDIEVYLSSLLNPENMVFTFYGDIDEENILRLTEEGSKGLQKDRHMFDPFKKITRVPHTKEFMKTMDIPQDVGVVFTGFDGVDILDVERSLKCDLLQSVMTGLHYPVGRLHHILRDKGYVYMAHGGNRVGLEQGHFILYALTSKAKTDIVLDLMMGLIKDIRDKSIEKEEFDLAISQMKYYVKDRISTLEALSIINATDEIYGLEYDHFTQVDALISKLTIYDVREIANQILQFPQTIIFK